MSKKSNAFFENGSWYHRTRTINDDYSVAYSKKGGFKTKEEAEKSLKEYELKYMKDYNGMRNNINDSITIKNYLTFWFENIFKDKIQSTTEMIASYTIYNLIIPNIKEDVSLKILTSEYINELIGKIKVLYSNASAKKTREIFNISLKYAYNNKIINYNPMINVEFVKNERKTIEILKKEEIKILLKEASKSNWYLEILLALFCGLRKGEILGLKFSDFNFKEGTVTIKRQLITSYDIENNEKKKMKIREYNIVERDPKTINSFRKLKVPDSIMQQVKGRKKLVEYYKMKNEEYNDNDYISCQSNGKPHGLSSLNSYIKKICKKLGLPEITVHGLRHMYATILMEQGVDLVKISAILGHESIHTTFEYYCDVMEDDIKIQKFLNINFNN